MIGDADRDGSVCSDGMVYLMALLEDGIGVGEREILIRWW